MALFALVEFGAAKRDTLVNGAIVTNFSCFANDDAKTMIDENSPTNGCSGMDFRYSTSAQR